MNQCFFILIFFGCVIRAVGQTSVVQDTKGETGLSLGSVGVVAINAKDESISFSYGFNVTKKDVGPTSWNHYVGASAKGKGKNGLAALFKNDEFQYDGNIGAFYFIDKTINGNNWQANFNIEYLFNQFKLYDSSSLIPFDKQVYDENKSGYKLTLGGSWYGNSPAIVGISFNGGHKNNTSDLKSLEVSTFFTDTSGNQTRIVQRDKVSAYDIKQYKESLGYFNINMDFGAKFLDQVMFLIHPRWSVEELRKPQFNPAIGLYFTKDAAPLEVVAGIQLQVADWANTAESLKSRKERTVINIVAGFTF